MDIDAILRSATPAERQAINDAAARARDAQLKRDEAVTQRTTVAGNRNALVKRRAQLFGELEKATQANPYGHLNDASRARARALLEGRDPGPEERTAKQIREEVARIDDDLKITSELVQEYAEAANEVERKHLNATFDLRCALAKPSRRRVAEALVAVQADLDALAGLQGHRAYSTEPAVPGFRAPPGTLILDMQHVYPERVVTATANGAAANALLDQLLAEKSSATTKAA